MTWQDEADELWEDANDIVALAIGLGYAGASRARLRAWHRHRVVPAPRQVGRGVHGTATLYPPGTATVFLRACELHLTQRKLKEVAWALWWNGFTDASLSARSQLVAFAERLAQLLDKFVGPNGELTEHAHDELDKSTAARLPAPFARVRRRAGAADFDFVVQSLLYIASGHVDALGDTALKELEHALGHDRARTDIVGSIGGPWLEGDVREDMENISSLASPRRFIEVIRTCSDDELDEARDEVGRFAAGLADLGYAMRKSMDNWAYGMAAWGGQIEYLIGTPDGQRYMVLAWLSCKKRPDLTPNLGTILASFDKSPHLRHDMDLLFEVREKIPGLAERLPLSLLRRILKDPASQKRIAGVLTEARKEHAAQIDEIIYRHRTVDGSDPV